MLTLVQAQRRGIQHAEVHCYQSNVARAGMIEANGGVLKGIAPHNGTTILRYDIALTQNPHPDR